jgi:hypothetical protein
LLQAAVVADHKAALVAVLEDLGIHQQLFLLEVLA